MTQATPTNLTIKAEIPLIPEKLRSEAAFLVRIADALENPGTATANVAGPGNVHAITPPGIGGHPAAAPVAQVPVAAVPAPAAAPVAQVPPAAAPVEVDAEHLPWDERIHASTKTKNADGTWRIKRNIPAETIEAVKAELRALMNVPAPAAAPVAQVPVAQVPVAQVPVAQVPVAAVPAPAPATMPAPVAEIPAVPAAVIPPVAAAPVVPAGPMIHPQNPAYGSFDGGATWVELATVQPPAAAPVVAAGPTNFPEVMGKITSMTQAGKTDSARVQHALMELGLQAPTQLATRPDLIPQFAARLDQLAGM